MNDCSHLRERLEDLALGASAAPELSDHLAECASCAADLEHQRALVQRIDAAVNAIVRAEPPQQLIASVTTRLTVAPGSLSRHGVRRWSAALAAAAVFALIVTVGFRAFIRPPIVHSDHSDLSALSSWRSPTASLLEPLAISPLPRPTPGATHAS